MKKSILFFLLIGLACSNNNLIAQSIFENKQEVLNYFEGSWKLEVINSNGAIQEQDGSTILEFEDISTTDSLLVLFKKFQNFDEQVSEVIFEIVENPTQAILPRWLFKIPGNSFANYGIMESFGFFGFDTDTITLRQMAVIDGSDYGLTRVEPLSADGISQVKIQFYPNPFTHELRIETIEKLSEIIILNSSGKQVYRDKLNRKNIDLGLLPAGLYYIRIKINSKYFHKTLVKTSISP